jgi:predicted SAM-dependent methyltransferase
MIEDKKNPYSIFSKQYLPNWKYLLRFEIISFFGRHFFQKKPPKLYGQNLLNLGCGDTYFNGWINADFFRVRFWIVPKNGWSLDLRYPLKCDNNYWDGIFTEHTLEHLHPLDDYNLLKELFRTLKPGCWLRICVPGLEQSLKEFYDDNLTEYNLRGKLYETKAEAIWSLTQNWGHLSVWNSELITKLLKEIGYVNVNEVSFRQGKDAKLLKDMEERKVESLYIEAQKPN